MSTLSSLEINPLHYAPPLYVYKIPRAGSPALIGQASHLRNNLPKFEDPGL
jgi:hypothetical protein